MYDFLEPIIIETEAVHEKYRFGFDFMELVHDRYGLMEESRAPHIWLP